jgi:hypothetical protein
MSCIACAPRENAFAFLLRKMHDTHADTTVTAAAVIPNISFQLRLSLPSAVSVRGCTLPTGQLLPDGHEM